MARKRATSETLKLARQKFGYDEMRPGQEEVIQLVLEGRDTLSVMPTGSGKSAIYQIAGLLVGGPTVVVSPLIALQKDQIEFIQEHGLAGAAVVNSMQRVGERRDAFDDFKAGDLEYLFLAPEQFNNEETLARVMANKPSLFVVDEAHCVSEWGHDFRPDYARLGKIIEQLGRPTILALTATASPRVREDIVTRLGMRDPETVVWGFDRPNIWLGVEPCPDEQTKRRLLLQRVQDAPKPGIVYVATQKRAEEICRDLREEVNVNAVFYHGGMKKADRDASQDAFMADKVEVVVATNAFGMGVDKPNVRFVIHYDVSESLDAYYQEVGRGGRDGEPARATLLYRPADFGFRKAMAAGGKLSEADVQEVADVVQGRGDAMAIKDVKEGADVSPGKVTAALHRLEDAGVVEILPGGNVVASDNGVDVEAAVEEVVEEQEQHRQYRQGRVELIKDYAETKDCRRRYLLNYFGETAGGPCGYCDNCEAGTVGKHDAEDEGLPFAIKSRVAHAKWGEGTVMRYEGDKVVVLFEEAGMKEMVTEFVLEKQLLAPA